MSTYRTSCGEIQEKLPLFVGGDLDGESLASVRAHLEACRACSERARIVQRAREALVRAIRPPAELAGGPSLWPGVRAALVAEGRIQPSALPGAERFARSGSRGRLRWLAPLAAAAALIAVLQGTGWLERAEPEKALPNVPEVAAPRTPRGGTLQRIAPQEVEELVPFQARRQELGSPSWLPGAVSTAGFRRR
ncbi:MAG TPA: zf-HC2 domain-containing protein [Planctomycetota bacterium]